MRRWSYVALGLVMTAVAIGSAPTDQGLAVLAAILALKGFYGAAFPEHPLTVWEWIKRRRLRRAR